MQYSQQHLSNSKAWIRARSNQRQNVNVSGLDSQDPTTWNVTGQLLTPLRDIPEPTLRNDYGFDDFKSRFGSPIVETGISSSHSRTEVVGDNPIGKNRQPTVITNVPATMTNKSAVRNVSGSKPPGTHSFRAKSASTNDRALAGVSQAQSLPLSVRTLESMESFQIKDAEHLKLYLAEQLILLQQQACKKIAKTWIKAICPRKQARCPYKQKSQARESQEAAEPPPWWPSTDLCRYSEPDHITLSERVNLLIHLLRLRPSPEQLRQWNGNTADSDSYLAYRFPGMWTEFLRKLTHPSLLTDIPKERAEQIKIRPRLLDQLFGKAQMEEDYESGGNDGIDLVAWKPCAKTISVMGGTLKRSRRHSRGGSEGSGDSQSTDSLPSSTEPRPKTKRAKLAAEQKTVSKTKGKSTGKAKETRPRLFTPATSESSTAASNVTVSEQYSLGVRSPTVPLSQSSDCEESFYPHTSVHDTFDSTFSEEQDIYSNTTAYTSFNEANVSADGLDDPWSTSAAFADAQYFRYQGLQPIQPQFQHPLQYPVQVHNVHGLPHPRLESTPDLSCIPHMGTAMGPDMGGQVYAPREASSMVQPLHAERHGSFGRYTMYEPQMVTPRPDQHWPGMQERQAQSSQIYSKAQPQAEVLPVQSGQSFWRNSYVGLSSQYQMQAPPEYSSTATLEPVASPGLQRRSARRENGKGIFRQ